MGLVTTKSADIVQGKKIVEGTCPGALLSQKLSPPHGGEENPLPRHLKKCHISMLVGTSGLKQELRNEVDATLDPWALTEPKPLHITRCRPSNVNGWSGTLDTATKALSGDRGPVKKEGDLTKTL